MKQFIPVSLFISLLILQAGCKTASNTASKPMSFNLSTGKSYDYDMQFEIDQAMMAQSTKMRISTNYSVDVLADSAGIKTLRGTYQGFKMNADMMGMKIDLDSDKPDTSSVISKENPMGMMSKVFSRIKGLSFDMKIDKKGKVLEVSGAEKFRDLMVAFADSMGMDKAQMEETKSSFTQQFNEESVRSHFSQVFTIFPDKEVKVGDSWEMETKGELPFSSTNTTTYTVKDIEGDMVTLEAKTKIDGKMSEGDVQMDIEGEQDGNLIVDSRSGLVVKSVYDQQIYMKAQGITIGMKVKGNITGKERR